MREKCRSSSKMVSQEGEPESGGHAQMAVSEMNDTGHDVFFPRSDRGITAYAYHGSSGTKLELERVNEANELPVEFVPQSEYFEKTALQVRILDFRRWNRSRNMMVRIAIADHPN